MREITLQRQYEIGDATIGRLMDGAQRLCVTLEELWVDANTDGLGDTNSSRIPAGRYIAFLRLSPSRGYFVFELRGVPGRKNVQIHKGNTTKDTLGCILLGERAVPKEPAIEDSREAFEAFMLHMGDEDFTLVVKDIA
jgi:hypothetical protein